MFTKFENIPKTKISLVKCKTAVYIQRIAGPVPVDNVSKISVVED